MGNLNPLQIPQLTFKTAGLLLSAGTKITRSIINDIAENTAFNWLGGRHPMRESFGVTSAGLVSQTASEATIDSFRDNDIPFAKVDESGLAPAIDIEVLLSSRVNGVRQFTTPDSYQVYIRLITGVVPNTRIDFGSPSFSETYDLYKGIANLYTLTVVSKESDSFIARVDFPQPDLIDIQFRNLQIEWFAKGW